MLFIITTGPPEIVAFGGPIPEFVSFDQQFGINYTPGETINMRMKYLPPNPDMPMAEPGSLEFMVDLASDMAGPFTSGPLVFSNLEGGILPGSEIGVYAQGGGTSPSDFMTVNFENFDFDGPAALACDFGGDGACDIADMDALVMAVVAGTNDLAFDLTGDNFVNLADVDEWRALAGAENLPSGNPYIVGDANLDGTVDGSDFLVWNNNKFSPTGKWSLADFTADGTTDGGDFLLWNNNKFMSADDVHGVPEPVGLALVAWIGCCCLQRRILVRGPDHKLCKIACRHALAAVTLENAAIWRRGLKGCFGFCCDVVIPKREVDSWLASLDKSVGHVGSRSSSYSS